MIKKQIKNILKKIVNKLGYTVQKQSAITSTPQKFNRNSMRSSLKMIKNLGFSPTHVFDVGVAHGTPALYENFTNTPYILIDPLSENEVFMKHYCKVFPDSHYYIAAAGEAKGEVEINIAPHISGSSIFYAVPEGNSTRKVPVLTLDSILKEKKIDGNFLLKIDTEGNEYYVLRGASEVLAKTEFVVAEIPIRSGGGVPDFLKTMMLLKDAGFTLFDIVDPDYGGIDSGELLAVDMIFIRENSKFRARHESVNMEQFRASVKNKIRKRQKLLEEIEGFNFKGDS